MNKKYFTALLPASNLEMELKRIQKRSNLYIPFPPLVPLEFYNDIIDLNNYDKNINPIEEFEIGNLVKIDNWWGYELPLYPLKSFFNTPDSELFPSGKFIALVGLGNSEPEALSLDSRIIRNWELAFYELTIWDTDKPLDNIEIKEIWKVKKKRAR